MLAVRHVSPHLASAALFARLRSAARYDADGRHSRWLWSGGPGLAADLASIACAVCPELPLSAWQGVLMQCYRDGNAVTPCHSDFGHAMGFILSLGATRTLRVHRTLDGTAACGDYDLDAVRIECAHGTALVMDGEFHATHHHQLVADPGAGERISLVFRTGPLAGR